MRHTLVRSSSLGATGARGMSGTHRGDRARRVRRRRAVTTRRVRRRGGLGGAAAACVEHGDDQRQCARSSP
eukprot:UN07191